MEWTAANVLGLVFAIIGVLIFIILVIWGLCAFSSVYGVWSEGKRGEAELSHAEYNRKIATLEAKAKEESAHHLAASEIIRAEGVAKANLIIGESLKGNEAYLRYLWIDGLQSTKGQVIYVPTEANLPLLEAGHRQRQ